MSGKVPTKAETTDSLHVRINSDTLIDFDAFCEKYGMSKSGATEIAIKEYMKKMNKVFTDAGL